ncbi:Chemotaxis response regulator protein-glutamate methylesterase [Caprobacter fermentans]|uniref:Stage 0 sporulation protein A homolog n=1 Tax=Caproicibacter fermentans TaxID=2576756 RepID=A0A6N8HUH1_9FIRM|nr:response regulator [Caproicibacter fermentans]MVB09434.1 Chemotaxis response regulator protein-glutamate methylesterase [Caproicibacter fermentans]OCN02960.1 histidine kinase [Clostridium sp. W14A]QNK41495.1 response regulator [Caproicibacter fermentans]
MIHVLIVDDSVFSQKVTANLLKKVMQGEVIEISFASDGEEGLEKFRNLKPDFIFIDLLMPKLSGAELVRIVQKEGGSGVVVVTADVQKSVREEIEAQNVLAFVNKPLNDEKMRLLCDRMIKDDKNGSGMLSL